ncbi:hypothetical protein ACVIGB_009779 [Bradyrhizobium sp. USDA 4341]
MRKTSAERKPSGADFGFVFYRDWWLERFRGEADAGSQQETLWPSF